MQQQRIVNGACLITFDQLVPIVASQAELRRTRQFEGWSRGTFAPHTTLQILLKCQTRILSVSCQISINDQVPLHKLPTCSPLFYFLLHISLTLNYITSYPGVLCLYQLAPPVLCRPVFLAESNSLAGILQFQKISSSKRKRIAPTWCLYSGFYELKYAFCSLSITKSFRKFESIFSISRFKELSFIARIRFRFFTLFQNLI